MKLEFRSDLYFQFISPRRRLTGEENKKNILHLSSKKSFWSEIESIFFILKKPFLWPNRTNKPSSTRHNLSWTFEKKIQMHKKTIKTLNLIKPLARKSNKTFSAHKSFEVKKIKIKEKTLKTPVLIKTLKTKVKNLVLIKSLKIKG